MFDFLDDLSHLVFDIEREGLGQFLHLIILFSYSCSFSVNGNPSLDLR